MTNIFPSRPADKKRLEEGACFCPKFDADGLIPCITTHAQTGEVLMFAYMNELSLQKTIQTGMVHYWSRSRAKLWLKGESSGMTQKVVQLLTDCDQDALVARVTLGKAHTGGVQASCHVGYPYCFYRAIPTGVGEGADTPNLETIAEKVFDPGEVYGKE